MVSIFINDISVEVPSNTTVLQACDSVGIDIPRFCFHERLLIAGNCRMCLVEIEKSPKPVASCTFPVMPGMKVFTDTPLVKKARESVLEFLLLNHPLDCPICDQGGECDLQDQAMLYGSDSGRFYSFKRGTEDKNYGPLVKTIMTRCIHCTRCVRFASEIAGISDLGTTGRGKKTEIGMYVQKFLKSELSGNVIDLCPVGALTSKPFAFSARSWELKSTDTIDLFDSVGSSIIVNTKGNEILRVLPRNNNSLNEEWITDKARFSYDGFKRQRLLKPFVKINKDSTSFSETDWPASFSLLKNKLNFSNSQIGFITGKFVDLESLIVAKELLYSYGSSNICDEISFSQNPSNFDFSVNYKFNKTLELVDKSDCCLLINLDTRFESSSLNIRLRRKVLSNELKLGYLGSSLNLTYNSFHLGTSRNDLVRLLEGRHTFSKEIQKANNPLIIFGTNSSDFNFNTVSPVMEQFNTIDNLNCVSLTPGLLNSNEMGNYAFDYKNMKVLFLLGADELDISDISEDTFVVYIGSHGDKNIYKADLILPSSCFTEKKGTFLNMEGKLQLTNPSIAKGSLVRDEWKVFRAFSSFINKPFSFKNLNDLSVFFKYFFNFSELFKKNNKKLTIKSSFIQENFKNDFKKPLVKDFFLSDFITRSSLTMHKCSGVLDKTNYQK